MKPTVRATLAAGALILLGCGDLLADTIHRKKAPIPGVIVFDETFKQVSYYPPGAKIKQVVDQKEVVSIEYDNWPEEWEGAKQDLAGSFFEDAIKGFLAASNANSEEFPQAKQYGLFMAADACVKWAESGNGAALQDAMGTFQQLLKAVPETVHLAKVHIGMGKCYLLMGKKGEALAEFNKVLAEAYFKPEDRVAAKVQIALVSELDGKYRRALDEYAGILDEANKFAPDAVPLVKVRIAACKVGLEQYDDAVGDFDRILSTAKTAAVKAAAYNGRGECLWKRKDYEKAMWDFLRVVVLYESITTESPKAFWYASMCMKNIAAINRKAGKKEEEKMWGKRSFDLFKELKDKFPGSPWTNK